MLIIPVKNNSDFVVEHEHLFLRNIYNIAELKVMKTDTTEKYSEIFEKMLKLFPVVETALEDEVESAEFKQFMEEDLDNLYNYIEEVKEYGRSIPVKKKYFCKIDYADKVLFFIYSELIKFESTGKIKGVPMSKNFVDNIKGILNNKINIHHLHIKL